MKKDNVVIETDRLWLRQIDHNDVDSLMHLFSDSEAMKYFPGTRNREETIEWISKIVNGYEAEGYSFNACIRKEDNTFTGYCGLLLQEDVDGKDEVEIGYGLIRKYWHNGYASEAAIACKNYGFKALGLNKIISLIRPENTPSRKVAERNGMTVEKEVFRWGFTHLVYSAYCTYRLKIS